MQSNEARAGLAVFLVAVAVVLFIVLQDDGSGDEEPSESATTPAQTGGTESKQDGKPEKPAPPPIPAIVVRDGAPVGGVQEIEATSGDRVRFRVSSDEEGDLHVHGYDIERPVPAGEPVTVSFQADLEGGYDIELHSHMVGDIPIAELAVNPG